MDVDKVRNMCVFTTHTPVEAAHDKFSYDLVQEVMGEPVPLDVLKKFSGQDKLNMTLLALNLSEYINGVSERHRIITEEMFPGYAIQEVTNGVHSFYWTCEHFRKLYNQYLPGWANEPTRLVRVDNIPDEEIWRTHERRRERLVSFARRRLYT